jgi:hypothetical protein
MLGGRTISESGTRFKQEVYYGRRVAVQIIGTDITT